MAKKWTRDERKRYLKEHYYENKGKLFAFAALAVIFILLLAALLYAVQHFPDPFLIIVLIAAIIVMIPVSAFLIDAMTYEME